MGILFAATGWAGWLGWQWRRTRTIGDDIKALKAQLPKPAADGEAPAAPAALTAQISGLEKVRAQSFLAAADRLGIQYKLDPYGLLCTFPAVDCAAVAWPA